MLPPGWAGEPVERCAVARPPLRSALSLLAGLVLALTTVACSRGGSTASASATTTPEPSTKYTVAGDSISVGLGAALRTKTPSDVVVKVIGEEGTGLARPDRFDWPTRLQALAKDFPPQVLVLSLASNDAQDLTDGNGKVVAKAGTSAWDAEYKRRLGATFDAFASTPTGTKVMWVGHVRTAEDRVGLANRHIHQLAVEEAASRPWVAVADLAQLLGTGEQKATRCLRDDGLHLTNPCLDEAATALESRLEQLRRQA